MANDFIDAKTGYLDIIHDQPYDPTGNPIPLDIDQNTLSPDEIEILQDVISVLKGIGRKDMPLHSVITGINMLQSIPNIPPRTLSQGYVFFTRPTLNLTYKNIAKNRKMAFLHNDVNSIGCAIKGMLMPKFLVDDADAKIPAALTGVDKQYSVRVDHKSPFVDILGNLIKNLTGFPDLSMNIQDSMKAKYAGQNIFADGGILNFQRYDISTTFYNTAGNLLGHLFHVWLLYMDNIARGIFAPFLRYQLQNRVDYQTRIYRIVLNKNKTHLEGIAATGASLPATVPIGADFLYNREEPIMSNTSEIAINFPSVGAIYNDPILIDTFNRIYTFTYPELITWYMGGKKGGDFVDISESSIYADINAKQDIFTTQIFIDNRMLFNFKAYPIIDPINYRMHWFVPKDHYTLLKQLVDTFISK